MIKCVIYLFAFKTGLLKYLLKYWFHLKKILQNISASTPKQQELIYFRMT